MLLHVTCQQEQDVLAVRAHAAGHAIKMQALSAELARSHSKQHLIACVRCLVIQANVPSQRLLSCRTADCRQHSPCILMLYLAEAASACCQNPNLT